MQTLLGQFPEKRSLIVSNKADAVHRRFQELAAEAREGNHDCDITQLRGILTWVSQDALAPSSTSPASG